MLRLGNQAFSGLFSHPSFTYSSAKVLCYLFPAHSDMSPGQCVPKFSTAPPCTMCRIPSNLGIPLLSLQLWLCTVMQGFTIPFWVVGALFSSTTGPPEPAPLEGGRGYSTFPKHCDGGCPGEKLFHNPCLCAVTPHVLGYSTSPPSRSASRGVCNACWLRLTAASKRYREKNNSVLLQTSTSRSLAQPPWVTERVLVPEPTGPGSTGIGPRLQRRL